MTIKLANNVSGFLNTAITASDTGIVLQSGNGASFPALGAGEYFYATLVSTGNTLEVVKVTARSGDSMTVVRAQDGTSAASFAAGSRLEIRVTVASVRDAISDVATASAIGFTPVGGISATNVQAAIAELDSEAAKSAVLAAAGGAALIGNTPAGTIAATTVQGAINEIVSDLAASSGASLVGFLQAGSGAVQRTVQSKLRDVVSVKDFGAVGDGVADDTVAIQAALDAHDYVQIPPGVYKISTLLLKRNNQVLEGSGFGNTTLASTVSSVGDSAIRNSSSTVTLVGCELRNLKIIAGSLTTGYVVNWAHIQLGKIERVWTFGGGANCTGFLLAATWTVTECTYNTVLGCYTGNVLKGFQLSDGANNNTFINCRAQPAYPGGYGFSLFGNAPGRISSNTIVGGGTEYPGNISGGVYVGQGSDCTTIIGHRFESLSVGVEIVASAIKTTLVGNYYDSNSFNILDLSSTTVRAEGGDVSGSVVDSDERIAVFNGITGTLTNGKGTSVTKNGTGDYTVAFTTNLKNATPLITISATAAVESRIFTLDATHVRVNLFDSAGFASDSGYVTVSAKAF